ncbi:hypothetical protein BZA70DRAFT_275633 [Myxozyma melibiosi]|uniref:C3H1-type domain-containing protein n=1 Tax=Myxozyma melibiosi TaxID=54550 RepID=A0ABR1F890_9ASCO
MSASQLNAVTRVNLPPRKVPCKFYMSGVCRRGSACWFKHGNESKELPSLNATFTQHEERGGEAETEEEGGEAAGAAAEVMIDQSAPESDDTRRKPAEEGQDTCCICLEVPKVYGLLLNCSHVFCVDCVRTWRKQEGMGSIIVRTAAADTTSQPPNAGAARRMSVTSLGTHDERGDFTDGTGANQVLHRSDLSKCCPLCRQLSDFIVPSAQLPVDPSEADKSPERLTKQEIIDNYLTTLKHIPCKHFKRNRICQFGNDCFYSHAIAQTPAPVPDFVKKSLRGESAVPATAAFPKSLRRQRKPVTWEYVFNSTELAAVARRYHQARYSAA